MLDENALIEMFVRRIEDVMGAPVRKITRPGGPKRPVFRAYLPDRSVIVLFRDDKDEAGKEREVLRALAPLTRHVPQLLAEVDGMTFMSDGGVERFPIALYRAPAERRLPMILNAIDALFDLQRAAAQTVLPPQVEGIGLDRKWIRHFLRGPRRMAKILGVKCPAYEVDALEPHLHVADPKFVKWDARAANAAITPEGHITWFDFEHCGLRHGAEDLSWLICEEVFPLRLETAFDPIAAHVSAADPARAADRIAQLELFGTFQASYRLRVVLNEVRAKKWTSQRDILATDLVGADSYMAERLARNGAFLAARRIETRPLVPLFEHTADVFARARQITAA